MVSFFVLALFAGLLSRHFSLLDLQGAHGQTTPIDGLRGVLATAVFFHHVVVFHQYLAYGVWQPSPSRFYEQMGTGAVTMFFFVSGFLFWRKAVRSSESVSWRVLIPNRMRRTIPAFYLAVLILIALVAVVSRFERLEPGRRIAKNIVEWLCFGMPFNFPSINTIDPLYLSAGVYWTLRLEWLFYLSLPLLVFFRSFRRVWLVFLLGFLASLWLTKLHAPYPWDGTVMFLLQYTIALYSAFSVGMLTVYVERVPRAKTFLQKRSVAAGCCVVGLIGILAVKPVYGLWESLPLAPSFVAIACGNDFFGLLTTRALRSLGAISYSLYVLHGLILYACLRFVTNFAMIASLPPLTYWTMACGIGAVVVFVSAVSFQLVEKPFIGRTPAASGVSIRVR